ncbi:MAG: tetratricopeptide repeat protein [Armatimonadota bacterium]
MSLEVRLRDDTTPAGKLVHAAFQRLVEGNLADALLGLESALALEPDLWSAHLLRSVILLQQGDGDGAEEHFRRAIQLEPDAVYHKATLERILADCLRPWWGQRLVESAGRLPILLGVGSAAVVLLLGVAFSAIISKHGQRRYVPRPTGAAANSIPVGLQPNVGYVPANPPAVAPSWHRFPAPQYPPAEDTSSAFGSQSGEQVPGNVGVLPPAQPLVGTSPDLLVPDSSGQTNQQAATRTQQQASAGGQSEPQERGTPENRPTLRSHGRADVGYEPSAPPPPVRGPQQAPTIPPPQLGNGTVGSAEGEGQNEQPHRPSGRELQTLAMQSERQGRREDAVQYYRQALEVYRQELSSGRDVESARRGIASCQAALNLLEAGM